MKIEITKDKLMEAINTAYAGIGNSSMAILKCFNINTVEDHVSIKGSDLATYCEQSVECNVIGSGTVNVSAANMKQLITNCSGKLSLETKDNMLLVTGSNMEYKLQIADQEYPEYEIKDYDCDVTMDSYDLCTMLESVSFCSDTSGTRPILDGVYVDVSDNKITVAATDTHRLGVNSKHIESSDVCSCVIPSGAVNSIIGICKKKDGAVNINISNTHFKISFEDGSKIITRVIEGQFPNYKRITPTNSPNASYQMNSPELLKKLNRLYFISSQDANRVRADISNNVVNLNACHFSSGNANETMKVDGSGEAKFIINGKYMMQLLKLHKSNIKLWFYESLRPMKFTIEDNDENYYVYMPMAEG